MKISKDWWMRYEPGAVLGDKGLMKCSFAAKGLWWIMLNHAFSNEPMGTMPGNLTQLVNMGVGGSEADIAPLLKELESANVFARGSAEEFRGDGIPLDTIISRRMYREGLAANKRKISAANAGRKSKIAKRNSNGTIAEKQDASPDTSTTCEGNSLTESKREGNIVKVKVIKDPKIGGLATAKKGKEFSAFCATFQDAWNAASEAYGVKGIRRWTDARRRALHTRSKDSGWIEDYPAALALIPDRPFLTGSNDRDWVADVDWFLKPDSVNAILEGNKYKAQTSEQPTNRNVSADLIADAKAASEREARNGGTGT